MSMTANSPHYERHMEEQIRADNNSHNEYLETIMADPDELPFDPTQHSPEALVEKAMNGTGDVLLAWAELSRLEKNLKEWKDRLRPLAVTEALKYEKDERPVHGCMFKVMKNAGARWDYSEVPQIKELSGKIKKLQEAAQSAFKAGGDVVIKETGEVVPAAKQIPGTDTVSVKFL